MPPSIGLLAALHICLKAWWHQKKKKGESKQKQKITQEQGHGKASKNKRRHGKEASRAWVTDRIQSDRIGKGVGPSGKKKPQKSGTLG